MGGGGGRMINSEYERRGLKMDRLSPGGGGGHSDTEGGRNVFRGRGLF